MYQNMHTRILGSVSSEKIIERVSMSPFPIINSRISVSSQCKTPKIVDNIKLFKYVLFRNLRRLSNYLDAHGINLSVHPVEHHAALASYSSAGVFLHSEVQK